MTTRLRELAEPVVQGEVVNHREAGLIESIAQLEAVIDRQRRDLAVYEAAAQGSDGVWFYQGDGYDYPETLACPVVMRADQFRTLLAAQPRAVPAERGRVITERGRFEYALKALVPDLYEKIRAEAYSRAVVDDDHNQFASWAADLARPAERVVEGWRETFVELLEDYACSRVETGVWNVTQRVQPETGIRMPRPRLAKLMAHVDLLAAAPQPGESNNKPTDCSGDPLSCPDNEGRGCYCSDLRRAGESA